MKIIQKKHPDKLYGCKAEIVAYVDYSTHVYRIFYDFKLLESLSKGEKNCITMTVIK